MRVALRVLVFEFALWWAMVLAGSARVAVQVYPFVTHSLRPLLRGRAWRVSLGLMIGIPVVAGWPALFLPVQAEYAAGDWLKIAIPWWIVVGALSAEILVARLAANT
jgi:hypothetical protein